VRRRDNPPPAISRSLDNADASRLIARRYRATRALVSLHRDSLQARPQVPATVLGVGVSPFRELLTAQVRGWNAQTAAAPNPLRG